ncbi:EF-hand domain-containing protein [Streptomyces sp. NPDC050504]|uniref:EF-hand domain-containing protein n=1 Tax=Streptomyces sp. NPDC050504 TaxID=3365618 RepID=UPI0037B19736
MDLRETRIRFRFDMLDADGSGTLEQGDFEALAERVIDSSGVAAESPRAASVRSAYLTYWRGLYEHADGNGDGVVDFDEYAAVVHDREAFDRYVRPYAEALVAAADRDGDGWVEREHYVAVMVATGFSTAGAEDTFAALDATGDGRVPAKRWVDAIAGYYTGSGQQVTDRLIGPA